MAKVSKKALGIGLAGVMSVGAIAGAVNTINQANAAESQAQANAKAKIAHTKKSIHENYAGIKNQPQWEQYIKEIRAFIAQMPVEERRQAEELTKEADKLQELVNAIACINHVEKSLDVNYHGIKNVAQWKDYLEKAAAAMKTIDKAEFQDKFDELTERYNKVNAIVTDIEEAHNKALGEVEKLYDAARKSCKLEDAQKALEEAKKLGTHETSAEMVKKIENLIKLLNVATKVDSVNITDGKTITVTGEGLHSISVEDIKVENNTATAVEFNDDYTSMKFTLKDEVLPNYETSVKLTVNGVETEYKLIYGIDVKTIEVTPDTFGHDRTGQRVKIKVNGKDVSVEYLKSAGYDVEFIALKSDGKPANIFEASNSTVDKTNTSNTGVISNKIKLDEEAPISSNKDHADYGLVDGTHKVSVNLVKDGKLIKSDPVDIKIVNMGATATSIKEVKLANSGYTDVNGTTANNNYVGYDKATSILQGSFEQNSNVLVTGEKASIHKVIASINGSDSVASKANVKVTSSNENVLYINSDLDIQALSPGNVTLTVKVGNVEKALNIKVTNEKRTLSKVTLDKSTITVGANANGTVKVKTFDQYGDPIGVDSSAANKGIKFEVGQTNSSINIINPAPTVDTFSSAKLGELDLTITGGAAEGTAPVRILSDYVNPNGGGIDLKHVLATLTVTVTKDANIIYDIGDLEITKDDGFASSFNLDLQDKDSTNVKFKLPLYNKYGVKLEDAHFIGDVELEDIIDEYETGIAASTPTWTIKNLQDTLSNCYQVKILNKDIVSDITMYATAAPSTVGNRAGIDEVTLKGKVAGSTQITINKINVDKDGNISSTPVNRLVKTVNVKNDPITITGVTFKSDIPAITFAGDSRSLGDLMEVDSSGSRDSIVKGITLSNGATGTVRLCENTIQTKIFTNDLYLDVDGDGTFSTGDKIVGHVNVSASPHNETTVNDIEKGIVSKTLSYSKTLYTAPTTPTVLEGTVWVRIIKGGQEANPNSPTTSLPSDITKEVGTKTFEVKILP